MIFFSVLRAKKEHHPVGWCSFLVMKKDSNALRVMRPASVARWVTSPTAASGGRREGAVSAAVGERLAHFVARRHCRAPQTGTTL